MPPKRAAAVCRGQLTLFQCAAKKQKQSIEDSESELAISHRSESESDSEPDPDGLPDRITGSPSQENYINVDSPSGSTTIVCSQSERQLPPTDISSGPLQPPTQPKIHFPSCSFGQGRPRAFNCEWYNSFRWIEYSIQKDAAYCYPCQHFTVGIGRSEDTFRITGFRD